MDIYTKIQNKYNELLAQDKLTPIDKLNEYYEKFRNNFGPEKLKELDGEELLNLMFDHSRRGLVYWLEFKNDEDFKTGWYKNNFKFLCRENRYRKYTN